MDANSTINIQTTNFMDVSLSLFSLWLFEMKCKNNTRICVPTCLLEYSAIIANFRILQPLQPAAAPMPQVALMGFFIEIQGGFSGFLVSHRCRNKEQLFQPFHKKPHWDVGCGNRLCNFLPSQIKNAYKTIRSSRPCEDTYVGSLDALFLQWSWVSICGSMFNGILSKAAWMNVIFRLVHLFPIADLKWKGHLSFKLNQTVLSTHFYGPFS